MTSSEAMAVGGDGGLGLFDALALYNALRKLGDPPKDKAALRAWLGKVVDAVAPFAAKTKTPWDDTALAGLKAALADDTQWELIYQLLTGKRAMSAAESEAVGADGKWLKFFMENVLPLLLELLKKQS